MGQLIRTQDWSGSPLGPPAGWAPSLRTAVELCLASGFPSFVFWGPELLELHNDAALRIMHLPASGALGQPLRDVWPESWETAQPLAERVLQHGETVFLEDFAFASARPSTPEKALFTFSSAPLRDAEGRVVGMVTTVIETTRRVSVERGLQENQRRLRSLVEGIPQLVWRATAGGNWSWCSPQWSAHTGLPEAESQGHGWLRALHPDDRPVALEAWQRAEGGEIFEAEYRICHAAESRYRWFQTRAKPVRDDEGRVVEWLGTSTDVDELRRLEEHQRLLMAELQHRGRNMLSVIRSLIRRTVRASATVDELAMHLDGRINAFARVQAAVTRDPGRGIDLAQLIADELLAHTARENERLRMEGPPVQLRPKAAETLGLAIHEMTTNAVKHGALSLPQGRIDVTWRIEEPPRLILDWQESGGPRVAGPRRRGFGTELLERTLPYDLGAKVTQSFGLEGLHCRIELPLTDRIVIRDASVSVVA
jgi:two-component system CheB/CheR fusion protein